MDINSDRAKGIRTAGNNHGHITIINSNIKVRSPRDAIHAAVNLTIRNSELDLVVGGGWAEGPSPGSSKRGLRAGGDTHNDGNAVIANIDIIGGNMTLDTAEDAVNASGFLSITDATLHISTGNRALRGRNDLYVLNSQTHIAICNIGFNGRNIEIQGGAAYVHHSPGGAAINMNGSVIDRPEVRFSMCNGVCHNVGNF
jgi:hypothetical protein